MNLTVASVACPAVSNRRNSNSGFPVLFPGLINRIDDKTTLGGVTSSREAWAGNGGGGLRYHSGSATPKKPVSAWNLFEPLVVTPPQSKPNKGEWAKSGWCCSSAWR